MNKEAKSSFPINQIAVKEHGINSALINFKGEIEFPSYDAIKRFIHNINEKKGDENRSKKFVSAGDLYGISVISRINRKIIEIFEQQNQIDLFSEAYKVLADRLDNEDVKHLSEIFINKYLPSDPKISKQKFTNAEILKKLFEIWFINSNPAFRRYDFLFSEKGIFAKTIYKDVINFLNDHFKDLPNFGDSQISLLEFIKLPSKLNPDSIHSQLIFIKENWAKYLTDDSFILLGIDFLEEQNKFRSQGPGPTNIYTFDQDYDEDEGRERFTEDKNWMPKVVLLTKSTYVWLDQLSKKFKRNISRLDEIPEEIFIELSQSGFNALWLIGIWERSEISKIIKRRCGQDDAMGSAYSIKKYDIAENLGGWEAYENLQEKALRHNIVLASDMVPNHTGMDAEWVLHHPEWYIQAKNSPFPVYKFTGENLLAGNKFELKIEDGYYDNSDAAVVFQWKNLENGETRFIYHGNDGTNLPWNDTAQLNYLKKEVRETIINKILEIAKRFHIIRFDAAMTLAKKHYQRLWFPLPGKGGAIPSRAEYGLTRAEFNKFFPMEFWREVVERIENEAPNTLLLAEAFWMMEGYFVQNLGMHRVYNSAFMNMLKDEENEKYKKTIFNVLEHNPQILKRFVNFMSNPDEETAIYQFGKGDKYFGICILMCTMPGLPMFAHGQIEGYREKYGMEYKQAKYDENTDYSLVKRHQKEIFPLLKKRNVFAEVDSFYLMNFYNFQGEVNDNVFAYLNGNTTEKALVIFNNKYEETEGFIKNASYPHRKNGKTVWQEFGLADLLNLPNSEKHFLILKNMPDGLEYIFRCDTLHSDGLEIKLNAYKYFVFMKMKTVEERQNTFYGEVYKHLKGKGVESIEVEQKRIKLLPLLEKFAQLIKPISMKYLVEHFRDNQQKTTEPKFEEYGFRIEEFLMNLADYLKLDKNISKTKQKIISDITKLYKLHNNFEFGNYLSQSKLGVISIFYWLLLERIREMANPAGDIDFLLDELLFGNEIRENIFKIFPEINKNDFMNKLKIGCKYSTLFKTVHKAENTKTVKQFFEDRKVRKYLLVNIYDDVEWYNAERFEELIYPLLFINFLKSDVQVDSSKNINEIFTFFKGIFQAHKKSNYKVKKLLQNIIESEDSYGK
ncbi:MAG: alpha-amylase family glycosyl hydrolase [Candidatus Cloacimonadota bacterium]|nr:alpha-amylase family glycosyl hydrolase [Candidatus Cloacimonadota bacterium]